MASDAVELRAVDATSSGRFRTQVHNAIMDSEIEAAKAKLAPYLLPHPPGRSNEAPIHRATRSLGALRGAQLTAFYDRVASIVGYPVDHLSEPILERRRAGQPYALREDRALLPLNPYGHRRPVVPSYSRDASTRQCPLRISA